MRAIEHVMAMLESQLDGTPLKDKASLLRDAAVEGCTVTAWSEDALTCYDEIVDAPSVDSCHAKLTTDQRKDLDERMAEIIRQAMP